MILDYLCLFLYKAYLRKKVRRPWDEIDRAMGIPIIAIFAPLLKLEFILFQGCNMNTQVILIVILCICYAMFVHEKLVKYHRRKVEGLLEKYNDSLPNIPLFFCVLLLGVYVVFMVVFMLVITEVINRYVYIPLGLEGLLSF